MKPSHPCKAPASCPPLRPSSFLPTVCLPAAEGLKGIPEASSSTPEHRAGGAFGLHVSNSLPSASSSIAFLHLHQPLAQGNAAGRRTGTADKQAEPVVELLSSELEEIQRALHRQLANARNFNLMIFLGKNVTRKSIPTAIHLLNNVFSCSKGS